MVRIFRKGKSHIPGIREVQSNVDEVSQNVMDIQLAVVENFEESLKVQEEVTTLQNAVVEIYEMLIGGE